MSQSYKIDAFVDYCFGFYGPDGLYAELFDAPVSRAALRAATELLIASGEDVTFDSFDREKIREIILFVRNRRELNRRAIG